MASRYSIIQYVPNPIADERVNIGVIAFDDEIVRVHFLQSWKRVKQFGNEDISFLREFADRMEESAIRDSFFLDDCSNNIPKHEQMIRVARGWMNSIQFTTPCGSLLDVESLLEDAAETYLVDTLPKKPVLRDRSAASRIAQTTVKDILKIRKLDENFLKTTLTGRHEPHKLDAVVANGKPYLALHGLSFEVNPPEHVLDALTWAIIDVKSSSKDLPFGVLALLPKDRSKDDSKSLIAYNRAIAKYTDWGAVILKEDEIEDWTNRTLAEANL